MKRLIIILIILLGVPALRAQTWSTLPVDVLVSMNTSTPGTTLTTAIANAGTISSNCTVGTNCSWNTTQNSQVQANQGAGSNLGPVTVNGGSTFAAQSLNFNNIAHDDNAHNTNDQFIWSGATKQNISILFMASLGFPAQGNGTDWDMAIIWDTGGHFLTVQINPSCNSFGEFGVRLESDFNNQTTHSATCVALAPTVGSNKVTYWFAANYDMVNGLGTLDVYTPQGTFIGSATVNEPSGGHWASVYIGNNEAGTNAGTFTNFQNLMIDWTNHANPLFWTDNSLATGVIAPGRQPASTGSVGWNGISGVVGGIPNRSNICTTLSAGVTGAQINTAVANCSAAGGGVVFLNAGTYTLTSGICFAGNSNVTLRGAGANLTLLSVSAVQGGCHGFQGGVFAVGLTSGDGNAKGCISNGPVLVTGMLNPGSNTITLASVSGGPGGGTSCPAGSLKVGNPIILDQLNSINTGTGGTVDNGGIFISQNTGTGTAISPGLTGPYTTGGNGGGNPRCSSSPSDSACYEQEQVVTVTQCDGVTTAGHVCSSGTNITISPGLHMPNWTTAFSMSAWWSSSPILNSGVEDMTIDNTGLSNSAGIDMFNGLNVWVKGVNSIDTGESHVRAAYTQNFSIVNNYFFLTQGGTSASYGFECNSGSDGLVENNIMHAVVSPQVEQTCTGTVVDYNYSINNYYPANPLYNVNANSIHSAGVDTLELEGNIGNLVDSDVIHGTHNTLTLFRNFYNGPQPVCYSSGATYSTSVYGVCNNSLYPIQLYAFSRFYNLIGNVLGTTGTNTVYSQTTACTGPNWCVLMEGGANGSTPSTSDANVPNTLMLWGNADPVTGFGSPRFNSSEVPKFPPSGTATSSIVGSQFPWLNPVPANQTLPASLYYSSKPSWWTNGKPWPPIGPDVSNGNLLVCTAGTYIRAIVTAVSQCGVGGVASSVAGGHANSIPAMDCYISLGGNPYGTGPVLANFRESACYSTGATLTYNPTSLAFGNQKVATTSLPQVVTMTNNSGGSIGISSITLIGTNATDFSLMTTCGSSIGAGNSCTMTVTYTPSFIGSEIASISITDDLGNQTVPMTGFGVGFTTIQGGASILGGATIQ